MSSAQRSRWCKVPHGKMLRAWLLTHPRVRACGWTKSRFIKEAALRPGPQTDTFYILCDRIQAHYVMADDAVNDILEQYAKDAQ